MGTIVAKKAVEKLDFEKSMQELETLIEHMEEGDISLEEALKHFERGISLTRSCQNALKSAEQQVQILLEKNGQPTLAGFDNDND